MKYRGTETKISASKLRNEDLEHIKEWLKMQPHLPDKWDELCLVNFMKGCKYSLEKCKAKLDKYFTMRTQFPEVFTNRDISEPEMQKLYNIGNICVLRDLTPETHRVTIVSSTQYDFDTPDLSDCFKLCSMYADLYMATEDAETTGEIYILDANINFFKHLLKISLPLLRKYIAAAQKAYPLRTIAIHVIHRSSTVNFIVNILKRLVKKRTRDRIHVHSSYESLYEFIPKEILPEEYGGNAGKMEDLKRDWLRKIEQNSEWFRRQDTIKADESKRQKKENTFDLLELSASCRQLNVD